MWIPYRMERRENIRHLKLVINDHNQVVIKMPRRVSEARALKFLRQNGDWILENTRRRPNDNSLWGFLSRNPWISVSGRRRRLRFVFVRDRSYWQRGDDGDLECCFDPNRNRERQLRELLTSLAREVIVARVAWWTDRLGVKPHGVTIRDQRSRWGSCSETGGLSFNWRLLLLPVRLQEHVILHELAHLRHFDHSQAFYRQVLRWDPRAATHSRMLDDWSARIMPLGRSEHPVAQ